MQVSNTGSQNTDSRRGRIKPSLLDTVKSVQKQDQALLPLHTHECGLDKWKNYELYS